MLRNGRDWQSILYLLALPMLVVWQWRYGFSWPLYALELFLTVGVCAIHHNHAHLRIWRSRTMNVFTDYWLTILQGHPSFVFHVSHNSNHHRHHHGPQDVARTYRFGGDTNHLLGYLLHPLQAVWILTPIFFRWLSRLYRHRPSAFRYCVAQFFAVGLIWTGLAIFDWRKWLVLVLIPQLHGVHWLLATNYLQHAHADGNSSINFARNFEGLVNVLMFNIGFHTAHHHHGKAHWSELPRLHAEYRSQIDPRLHPGGLFQYMLKTYVLSLFLNRYRSESLMKSYGRPDDAGDIVHSVS